MAGSFVRYIQKNKFNFLIGVTAGVLFALCFCEALLLDIAQTPDEQMRLKIPYFIYEHGYLPVGDEKELIEGNIFGFSYGFSTYLPSLFSALFMKIISFFSNSQYALLVAARFFNVLTGAGTFLVCIILGEKIFTDCRKAYFFACLCSFLPQFIFLSGYLNNDSPSVFATALVAFCWIVGIEKKWSIFSCVKLGLALGVLALTYYTAYGFILMSILVFCIGCYKIRNSFRQVILRGLLILFVSMLSGGWFFVRNALIHDGDFLGMNAMYECGEENAVDEWKPSNRNTPANQDKSLYDTFTEEFIPGENWISNTGKSFVGSFGYMTHPLSMPAYIIYLILLVGAGGIGLIFSIVQQIKSGTWKSRLLFFSLIGCFIIPFLLSMYYSYYVDFQAQGRYIISIMIPLMYFVVQGMSTVIEMVPVKWKRVDFFWNGLIILWLGLTLYAYFCVLMPGCFKVCSGL